MKSKCSGREAAHMPESSGQDPNGELLSDALAHEKHHSPCQTSNSSDNGARA